jgi:hypothetical protein
MKKSLVLALSLTAFFLFGLSTVEASSLQQENLAKFDAILKDHNLTSEEFRNLGSRYFNEKGELVVQFKKNPAAKIVSSLYTDFADEMNIIVENVRFSEVELFTIQDEFFGKTKHLNLSKYTKIAINEENNGLILQTPVLTDEQNERILELYNEYGEGFIEFDIDSKHEFIPIPLSKAPSTTAIEPNFSNALSTQTRFSNFSELGAGIGLKLPTGNCCTIGGIGHKSFNHFIITAGHWLTNDYGFSRQFNLAVGRKCTF